MPSCRISRSSFSRFVWALILSQSFSHLLHYSFIYKHMISQGCINTLDTSIITIGSNIIWDSRTIFSEKAFHIIFLKPSAALLFNIYSAKTVNHPVLIQLHISTNPILSRALINCPIMPTLGFYPLYFSPSRTYP